jgi:hypothetical protein
MSGRLFSRSAALLAARRPPVRLFHYIGNRSGGILSPHANAYLRPRVAPLGASWIHNVPATRAISFSRLIPKLAVKLVRVPAMFGGAVVAGLAYVQYQASRKSHRLLHFKGRDG